MYNQSISNASKALKFSKMDEVWLVYSWANKYQAEALTNNVALFMSPSWASCI